mmetsp:Transcript_52378/g.135744  ORF Transcript_52378/g.135744 Transcript_52378/m.135744 type:complete len:202 (-) Transcript_52378:291-896(-)
MMRADASGCLSHPPLSSCATSKRPHSRRPDRLGEQGEVSGTAAGLAAPQGGAYSSVMTGVTIPCSPQRPPYRSTGSGLGDRMLVTEYMAVDGDAGSSVSAGCTKLLAMTPRHISDLRVYESCRRFLFSSASLRFCSRTAAASAWRCVASSCRALVPPARKVFALFRFVFCASRCLSLASATSFCHTCCCAFVSLARATRWL